MHVPLISAFRGLQTFIRLFEEINAVLSAAGSKPEQVKHVCFFAKAEQLFLIYSLTQILFASGSP